MTVTSAALSALTLFTRPQSDKVPHQREEPILLIYQEYRTTSLQDNELNHVLGGELRL